MHKGEGKEEELESEQYCGEIDLNAVWNRVSKSRRNGKADRRTGRN